MKKLLSTFVLSYLRLLARLQIGKIRLLQKLQGRSLHIVGITGSAGKTSTLYALRSALGKHFKTKTNLGANSESGIPLNILGLKISTYSILDWLKIILLAPLRVLLDWSTFDVYIVEMGIDSPHEPKNMSYLLKIITPDIGVFLNVSPVHLQNFKSIDQIAQEKAKLVNTSPVAIANITDPLVKKYTTNPHLIPIQPFVSQHSATPLPPVYQISLGAACAVGQQLGLTPQIISKNISKYLKIPPSRSTILRGIRQSTIIDSSYNSSPLAATEMLKFLASFPSPRIAVLGDMRELGSSTAPAHKTLYAQALKIADIIISVGPETNKYFGSKSKKFLYWWQAADYLQDILPPKSAILAKGSQNTIFLEELIKKILKNKRDSRRLCRQSAYWLKTKQNFFRSINQIDKSALI